MIPTNVGRSKATYYMCLALLIPVIWFAVILAQEYSKPIDWSVYFENVHRAVYHPFDLYWTDHTLASIGACCIGYALIVLVWLSEPSRFRSGIEHGSARWAKVSEINKIFEDKKDKDNNFIITDNALLGMDVYRHGANLHMLCIGGSGQGKSRYVLIPNVLQSNCNYFITDPSGELLRATGEFLKTQGYDVRVINLVNMDESDSFNPFPYFRNEEDVLILVDTFIKNTTDALKGTGSDPFWEKAERFLITSICFYLREECPQEDQNFPSVLKLAGAAQIKEDQEDFVSALDILFTDLERRSPRSVAARMYKEYKISAGKTAKSILVQVFVRLSIFDIPRVAAITSRDDMRLGELATQKVAIFAVIPDTHSTFNSLVGMMYSTMFTHLSYIADNEYHGMLPRHVRCLMDEFRNVKMPDDFLSILSSVRKRNISMSIFVQNITQLQALYKEEWQSLVGNCSTYMYLGGGDDDTLKKLSEKLGNETIDKKTYGISRGQTGSSSENRDTMSHPLLAPNEIQKLDKKYCLVFLPGQDPLCDQKFRLKRHKNYKYTSFGRQGKVYVHQPIRDVFDYSTLPITNDYTNIYEYEIE